MEERIVITGKNGPVHQYQLGKIVTTVWFNDENSSHGRHSVSINRLYKPNDEDGWQQATTFGRDDLPLAGEQSRESQRVVGRRYNSMLRIGVNLSMLELLYAWGGIRVDPYKPTAV